MSFYVMACQSTAEAKRVALVVGNADYEQLTLLPNPVRDAKAIAGLLQRHNIQTTLKMNLSREQMLGVLADFEHSAAGVILPH
jgi:uncharacterized caspase-like protein